MLEFLQQVLNGFTIGSCYAVIGLGFGLVFGVLGICNIAHMQTFMLGCYVAFVVGLPFTTTLGALSILQRVGIFLMVVVAAGIFMALIGLIMERLILRPLRGTSVIIPFIATFGAATAMNYGTQTIFGTDPVWVPSFIPGTALHFWGLTITSAQLTTLLGMAAMLYGLRYYVYTNKWGKASRAVAERHDTAAACGVNVNIVFGMTLAISAAAAGAAGVLVGQLYNTASPFVSDLFGTKAFICVMVAGNRKIEGMMFVGLMLGIVEALVAGYISSTYRDAVAYFMLLSILFFQPRGFFGSYGE